MMDTEDGHDAFQGNHALQRSGADGLYIHMTLYYVPGEDQTYLIGREQVADYCRGTTLLEYTKKSFIH